MTALTVRAPGASVDSLNGIRSAGQPTSPSISVERFTPTQLFQLIVQLAPLDLRDAEFLTDLVGLFAGAVIIQGAGPATHIEGEVLRQARLVPDIFEQIFQPPR